MDITSTSLAGREAAMNKASIDQEIVQRTLRESEKSRLVEQPGDTRPVEQSNTEKQGLIDIYA